MAMDYSEDRRTALCEWLTANGIEPNNVPLDSDLTITTDEHGARTLHHEEYALNSAGRRHIDERLQQAARTRRSTPLVVEPPTWWEPYEKPTRDDLLEVLGRVQSAAEQTAPGGDGVAGEYEFGWDAAMAAVKTALRESVRAPSA